MIDEVERGLPYNYRVRFSLEGVIEDLTDYSLSVKVTNEDTGNVVIDRVVTSLTQDSTGFIVEFSAIETQSVLGIGTFCVRNKVLNTAGTVGKSKKFTLYVTESC